MDQDDAPDTSADEADIRDEAGRFRAGHSGNPLGSPPGSRALRLARTLAEAGIAAVVIVDRPARPTSPAARRPRRIAA